MMPRVLKRLSRAYFGDDLDVDVVIDIPPVRGTCCLDRISSPVPAATYLAAQNRIILHPYLIETSTPVYVFEYLILHAAARMGWNIRVKGEAMDSAASAHPRSSMAEHWLRQHGFPTPEEMPCAG
jgi:hypothetical protein